MPGMSSDRRLGVVLKIPPYVEGAVDTGEAFDEVKCHVYARADPGARNHVTIVDETVVPGHDRGIELCEQTQTLPMRRRRPCPENTGSGVHEAPGAHARHERGRRTLSAYPIQMRVVPHQRASSLPTRVQQDVKAWRVRKRVVCTENEPLRCPNRTPVTGDAGDLVSVVRKSEGPICQDFPRPHGVEFFDVVEEEDANVSGLSGRSSCHETHDGRAVGQTKVAGMPQIERILPESCDTDCMHRIVALALPDVVAFDLAIPAQVFGHSDERERYTFSVCAEIPGLIPTTSGFAIEATRGLDSLLDADTVIVPGFVPLGDPSAAVLDALREASHRGIRMVSVCTGAFALAAAGLLDGKRATTHWRDAAELSSRYPRISVDPDVLYVVDGGISTSAGVAAGIDLCLHLVRQDFGTDAATGIARRMVVAPHRDGGQAQFIERPVVAHSEGLAATCAWAVDHLAEPISVADMAKHARWSPRTFARRFLAETGTTPLRWLTSRRVDEARRLLEVTDLTVEAIAQRCGLGTSSNLRFHFAGDLATTPTNYRRIHRGT